MTLWHQFQLMESVVWFIREVLGLLLSHFHSNSSFFMFPAHPQTLTLPSIYPAVVYKEIINTYIAYTWHHYTEWHLCCCYVNQAHIKKHTHANHNEQQHVFHPFTSFFCLVLVSGWYSFQALLRWPYHRTRSSDNRTPSEEDHEGWLTIQIRKCCSVHLCLPVLLLFLHQI